jgi:hypothetical protein
LSGGKRLLLATAKQAAVLKPFKKTIFQFALVAILNLMWHKILHLLIGFSPHISICT